MTTKEMIETKKIVIRPEGEALKDELPHVSPAEEEADAAAPASGSPDTRRWCYFSKKYCSGCSQRGAQSHCELPGTLRILTLTTLMKGVKLTVPIT